MRAAQQARTEKLQDFELTGSAVDPTTGEAIEFQYAMKQPRFAALTLTGKGRFITDGASLVAIDDATKKVTVTDLKAMAPEEAMLLVHQVYRSFACEGWRPPLMHLSAQGRRIQRSTQDGQERWVVEEPLSDPKLTMERYVLRAPTGDFLYRQTLDGGAKPLASTEVLDELKDQATGLMFPRRWRRTDAGGTYEVTLRETRVNQGIPADRFSMAAPDGYEVSR